jgi:hypothetical protein
MPYLQEPYNFICAGCRMHLTCPNLAMTWPLARKIISPFCPKMIKMKFRIATHLLASSTRLVLSVTSNSIDPKVDLLLSGLHKLLYFSLGGIALATTSNNSFIGLKSSLLQGENVLTVIFRKTFRENFADGFSQAMAEFLENPSSQIVIHIWMATELAIPATLAYVTINSIEFHTKKPLKLDLKKPEASPDDAEKFQKWWLKGVCLPSFCFCGSSERVYCAKNYLDDLRNNNDQIWVDFRYICDECGRLLSIFDFRIDIPLLQAYADYCQKLEVELRAQIVPKSLAELERNGQITVDKMYVQEESDDVIRKSGDGSRQCWYGSKEANANGGIHKAVMEMPILRKKTSFGSHMTEAMLGEGRGHPSGDPQGNIFSLKDTKRVKLGYIFKTAPQTDERKLQDIATTDRPSSIITAFDYHRKNAAKEFQSNSAQKGGGFSLPDIKTSEQDFRYPEDHKGSRDSNPPSETRFVRQFSEKMIEKTPRAGPNSLLRKFFLENLWKEDLEFTQSFYVTWEKICKRSTNHHNEKTLESCLKFSVKKSKKHRVPIVVFFGLFSIKDFYKNVPKFGITTLFKFVSRYFSYKASHVKRIGWIFCLLVGISLAVRRVTYIHEGFWVTLPECLRGSELTDVLAYAYEEGMNLFRGFSPIRYENPFKEAMELLLEMSSIDPLRVIR